MAKTIFHTTEKSNFILNMDLDRYRAFCARALIIVFTATACSAGFNQLTEPLSMDLAEKVSAGGFAGVMAMLAIVLRSVANIFSVAGVLAIITMVVGLMRKQIHKRLIFPYIAIVASLLWGVLSLTQSFSTRDSLFGQDGRDEGLFTLLMYAAIFYLGTMLRHEKFAEILLDGLLIFGIVQCGWGLLQAQPFFDFPSEYKMVDPLLLDNLRLPSGLTDSPVTFGMLLGLILGVSIPTAAFSQKKSRRITALVCAGLSLLLVFKTQTFAGLVAGAAGVLICVLCCLKKGRSSGSQRGILAAVAGVCVCGSLLWTYFTPSLNNVHSTRDNSPVPNGFAFYDGGIVWDDGFYRLSTSGPYKRDEEKFIIGDSSSVLSYCWKDACSVIAKYPFVGTGPDNYSYSQLKTSMTLTLNSNSIDRPYNDYLFIAATRGIPSLVLHLALLVSCFVLLWKRRRANSWMTWAFGGAALTYALCSVVGVSVLTVAPVFWAILGAAAAEPIEEPKPVTESAPEQPDKAKQSSQSDKGKQPSQQSKGKQSSQPDKGKQPAQQNKGKQPTQPNKAKQPAQQNKGKQPAQPNKGKQSSQQSKGKQPAQQNKGKQKPKK